ncbi:MAG TPA: glycosyltransferase [Opitutaceae bacterium]|nr:glycosyltransferase [Opitutaceae bacterium]
MRVLHVLYTARAEGTVKLALDWLGEPGLSQGVLVLNPNPVGITPELRNKASWYDQAERVPAGRAKFPWILLTVWRTCRRRRPDLLICWPNGFSPWILTGARLAGTRRLITHAGNPPNWHLMGRVQGVLSTFVARATGGRMVCCSQYVAGQIARMPGVFASILRVVPNCAPVERIRMEAAAARSARRDASIRLIMVATLEPHKDHATLLRSMPAVRRAVPSAELWLVGDGSLRQTLQDLCASLGVSDAVSFRGSRLDVPTLLGQSDVFVFSTTKEEGLGTVLVEAMAAGLPIVASDVPACRETLEGGKWGTLVRAGDADVLATALIESLLNARIDDSAGKRDYLGRFLPARMVAAYIEASASTRGRVENK